VVSRTFRIYVDQASVLLPASAVVFVVEGIVARLLIAASSALVLVSVALDVIATTLFTGMVVELVADVQDGRRDASVGQLLRAATPVLGQLILVGIIAGLGEALGLVLLIVPGLILLTLWAVSAPVVVLERPGAVRALGRSRDLVRGNGWAVFAVVLLFAVILFALGFAAAAAAASAGSAAGLVAQVVVNVLAAPLVALASAVLYFELRRLHAQDGGVAEPAAL
jgi:uncharacterized protein UPF0259